MVRKKANPVSLQTTADVELGAAISAKYIKTKSVSETIPQDVTRANASAWLDFISPLTEWAGLKGDALRHKREILRIQREDILNIIAQKCKYRIISEKVETKEIPNKFLVPFLEQASLEDPESSLVDMWANLFVSAARGVSSYHTHFVGIISRMSPQQGLLLKEIVGTDEFRRFDRAMDDVLMWYQGHVFQRNLAIDFAQVLESKKPPSNEKEWDEFLCEFIETQLNICGIEVVHVSAENKNTDEYFDIPINYSIFTDDAEIDFNILEDRGLIKKVDTSFFDFQRWNLVVIYYHVTELGRHFIKACKLVN